MSGFFLFSGESSFAYTLSIEFGQNPQRSIPAINQNFVGHTEMINIKMQENQSQTLSPKIAVIGVGGGGGNAVNNMIAENLEGCDFVVCNSDAQALKHSLCENRVQLGTNVTGGLGAGSKPEVGRAAAEESLEDVMRYLDGANMAFVTAGMGGGTGTGAAPVIAKACRERGILTVGVVTKPFHFEGSHRMKMAEEGLKEMQQYVDTLIVIPNQNLFRVANEKTTFADGFKMADSVLQSGVRGVTDLMVKPGLVNLDFADIRTAMLEMGKAMMGTGEASGEKRAIEAAEAAINNPLLDDVTMKGARGVIINVTGGYDMTLFEADEACNRIRDEVDPDANIIFGATFDENMEGKMRVSIVATGIEREAIMMARGGKDGLARAVPNQGGDQTTDKPAEDHTPVAYKTGIDNVRGITAPTSVAAKAATSAAAQNAAASLQQQGAAPQNEHDDCELFEQAEFVQAPAAGVATPAGVEKPGTALRGSVYKNAFIPPKPAMPEAAAAAAAASMTVAAPTNVRPPQYTMNPAATNNGLVLNPPRARYAPDQQQPQQAPQRSPSFFERLAGSVQQRLEGFGAPSYDDHQAAPAPMPQQARGVSSPRLGGGAMAQEAPAQGQLNIDAPAAAPKGNEDELDIPAFLRRQAN
jgi:cell division protein FtsZ